jgi:hypothetical protein
MLNVTVWRNAPLLSGAFVRTGKDTGKLACTYFNEYMRSAC